MFLFILKHWQQVPLCCLISTASAYQETSWEPEADSHWVMGHLMLNLDICHKGLFFSMHWKYVVTQRRTISAKAYIIHLHYLRVTFELFRIILNTVGKKPQQASAVTAHQTANIESFSHSVTKALLSGFTSLWRERDTGREDMTRWTSSVDRHTHRGVSRHISKLCSLWCSRQS